MQTDYTSSDCPVPDFPGLIADGGAVGPSLDRQETSEQSEDVSSYRHFITSGCRKQITAARKVYEALDDDKAENRLAAFNSCRSSAYFVRHAKTGKVRVVSSRCGQRWCPLCIRVKSYIIQQSVSAWLKTTPMPKFLTLTLKHTNAPLENQIDALYKAWKELRRVPFFKKRIKGGIWFFQVKISKADGMWHPHIHILCEGRFVEHAELKKMWSKITHGSDIVDIRSVKNPKKVADYVARYAAAPCTLSELDHNDALACVKALHSRRICGTFGTGRKIKLTPKPPEDAKDWIFVGSWSSVINQEYSNQDMAEVIRAWKTGDACSYVPPEPPPMFDAAEKSIKAEPEPFRQPEFIFCK
jgi:hypothetical protein